MHGSGLVCAQGYCILGISRQLLETTVHQKIYEGAQYMSMLILAVNNCSHSGGCFCQWLQPHPSVNILCFQMVYACCEKVLRDSV